MCLQYEHVLYLFCQDFNGGVSYGYGEVLQSSFPKAKQKKKVRKWVILKSIPPLSLSSVSLISVEVQDYYKPLDHS